MGSAFQATIDQNAVAYSTSAAMPGAAVAGYPANPYASSAMPGPGGYPAASPYGGMYGASPYGASPYGSSPYGASPYARMSPYGGSGYGGMYGGGYGGGYGGYASGGMYGGMGQNPNDPNSLTNRFSQSTATTFQMLEGLVGTFGGFAQMLESTYMATHSSFYGAFTRLTNKCPSPTLLTQSQP